MLSREALDIRRNTIATDHKVVLERGYYIKLESKGHGLQVKVQSTSKFR